MEREPAKCDFGQLEALTPLEIEALFSEGSQNYRLTVNGLGEEFKAAQTPEKLRILTFAQVLQKAEDEGLEISPSFVKLFTTPKGAQCINNKLSLPYKLVTDKEVTPADLSYLDEHNLIAGQWITPQQSTNWRRLVNEFKKTYPEFCLTISSGYRSPAYQLFLITHFTEAKQRTLGEQLKTVAPPFHSRHCLQPPALDVKEFFCDRGNQASTRATSEWRHFASLLSKYGFSESYKAGDNPDEPWEILSDSVESE